jgi:hypothetical protein
MNRQIVLGTVGLWTVGRPEPVTGHVGQHFQVVCRDLRNGVNSLSPVRGVQNALAGIVKDRTLLEVVGPIGNSDGVAGFPVGFDRVLVAR